MAQERLTIHTHEALCSQETRPHRMSERFVGDGRLRLSGLLDTFGRADVWPDSV